MTENHLVTIIKLTPQREDTWRYDGRVLAEDQHSMLIEAYFNRKDLPFHGITLNRNDRFLERYFFTRWYNIFEIHDREDDHLKGWYCNVTQPAEFSPGKIAYVDLALDLLVYPNGKYLILDEEEFANLPLSSGTREKSWQGLRDLIEITKSNRLQDFLKY